MAQGTCYGLCAILFPLIIQYGLLTPFPSFLLFVLVVDLGVVLPLRRGVIIAFNISLTNPHYLFILIA